MLTNKLNKKNANISPWPIRYWYGASIIFWQFKTKNIKHVKSKYPSAITSNNFITAVWESRFIPQNMMSTHCWAIFKELHYSDDRRQISFTELKDRWKEKQLTGSPPSSNWLSLRSVEVTCNQQTKGAIRYINKPVSAVQKQPAAT